MSRLDLLINLLITFGFPLRRASETFLFLRRNQIQSNQSVRATRKPVMNMRNHTTSEETKALVEAGLDTRTADMVLCEFVLDGTGSEVALPRELGKPFFKNLLIEDATPCWSLSALLGVLPDNIMVGGELYSLTAMHDVWTVGYEHTFVENSSPVISVDTSKTLHSEDFSKCSDEYIHAVADLVVWALREGHIENGGLTEDGLGQADEPDAYDALMDMDFFNLK